MDSVVSASRSRVGSARRKAGVAKAPAKHEEAGDRTDWQAGQMQRQAAKQKAFAALESLKVAKAKPEKATR